MRSWIAYHAVGLHASRQDHVEPSAAGELISLRVSILYSHDAACHRGGHQVLTAGVAKCC